MTTALTRLAASLLLVALIVAGVHLALSGLDHIVIGGGFR
jgi:hypothetical protein